MYSNINYETVPSLAMKKYRKAFERNDEERFSEFLSDVKEGKRTIKAGTLFPYDIVNSYIKLIGWYNIEAKPYDEVLEQQWKSLPNYIDKPMKALVVADTSGSMNGMPINVALSLALYASERNPSEHYKNKMITFSRKARYVLLNDKMSLKSNLERIPCIVEDTNLESVFQLILATAINNNIPQNELPEQVIIISDMQMNCGSEVRYGRNKSFMSGIKDLYKEHGYELPQLVWWQVSNERVPFPMTAEDNCIFVSGMSAATFKAVIAGKYKSPLDVIIEVLSQERYSRIYFE